jgi:hypothetical protein
MALTKLTKHIVYGATIVQCRYKDLDNLDASATSVTTWDAITLTPQYSDSILEVRFSGLMKYNNDSSSSGNNGTYDGSQVSLFMDINGTTEYVLNDAANTTTFDYSYGQGGANRLEGKSVNMFHRHLPGSTNQQTITMQVSRANSNGGGNTECRNGFLMAKEIAGGILTGTPGNAFVN